MTPRDRRWQSAARLDLREHKANNPTGTAGIASPTTRSSWFGSPAASARAAAPFVWLDWRRNSGRRSSLRDLADHFSYDCMWRAEAHGRKGKSGCGVYLPDLEQPRPPDAPPGMVKLRLVKKGLNYLTCAPTAEYAVSSAVSGPEAEHPPTLTNASIALSSEVFAIRPTSATSSAKNDRLCNHIREDQVENLPITGD
jgi:hypothetical protein